MSVLSITHRHSAAGNALARVTRQLEKVTDELIRSLFARTRTPSPEKDVRIFKLELKRDELHERLDRLEEWAKASPGISEEQERIAS
ncbi:MAG: hypothetical protein M3Y59_12655 [Myxococcota bacterium]|nr:hypothetical protein [Myxococcota bacterium]